MCCMVCVIKNISFITAMTPSTFKSAVPLKTTERRSSPLINNTDTYPKVKARVSNSHTKQVYLSIKLMPLSP